MKRAVLLLASSVGLGLVPDVARAADLTLPTGGRVTVELLSSSADLHNTLALATPNAAIAVTGCRLEPFSGLPGLALLSEKTSQHGCRVELDADLSTPGIQPFAAGTVMSFNMCAQTNTDPACEYVWSSNLASNPDNFDHVHTDTIAPGVFRLSWEDLPQNISDLDFNDLIAVVRINQDSDGDGLWDDWETIGIDTNGDGAIDLDLPALGANPNHKDIFVEIDWMDCAVAGGDCAAGDTHNHQPKAAAVAAVVAAFANAPVLNPDGVNGINIHIDLSNSIAHQNNLNINGLCFAGGTGIGSFDAVKADPANFGPDNPRRFAYHYALFSHQQVSTSTSSGCGEYPGNDFQVALGGWNVGYGDRDGDGLPDANVGTVQQQAGTLMHELGHNLNLGHGGGDSVNYKPNFLSIMNYRYQVSGIPPTDPDGAGPLKGRVDYSETALANLDETNLDETVGVGDGTDTVFWFCPNGSLGSGVGNGALDWNCNGSTADTGVQDDTNADHAKNTLVGYDDWNNILYAFQGTSSYDDGFHDDSIRVVEIDHETYLTNISPELGIHATATPPMVVTGSALTIVLTVSNSRSEAATQVVVTDALPAGVSLVSCASTGDGVCSGMAAKPVITFASIAGGATETITLVGSVDCALPNGTTLTDTAEVSMSVPDPDPSNNQATVSVITVNPPPVINGASTDKSMLWPPNHEMVDVAVSYTATDNCGVPVCQLSVTSNEPINGLGDGDQAPDWQIIDAHHVKLRAERSGFGTGRIYTVTVGCSDSGGGSSQQALTVKVPLSQTK
jgi:uncharacterized repeat protein (TIGR01451 family)